MEHPWHELEFPELARIDTSKSRNTNFVSLLFDASALCLCQGSASNARHGSCSKRKEEKKGELLS